MLSLYIGWQRFSPGGPKSRQGVRKSSLSPKLQRPTSLDLPMKPDNLAGSYGTYISVGPQLRAYEIDIMENTAPISYATVAKKFNDSSVSEGNLQYFRI